MNKQDALNAVSEIAQMSGDAELAHSAEDRLHERFIEFIASQHLGEFSEMAKIILTTSEIDFPRWCA